MKIELKCAALCNDSYSDVPGRKRHDDLSFQIHRDGESGQVIIAFRGTANKRNIIRDLRFIPEGMGGGVYAHRGFVGAFYDLLPSMLKVLSINQQKVVFTGHSLGGAIALLMGSHFKSQVITFGCPRVYARWSKSPEINHVRIVCDDDPVPMIPRILFHHLNDVTIKLTDNDGGIDVADHSMLVYSKRLEEYK